jgi:ribosomal protein S9
MSDLPNNVDVAIVGGGLAGLTTARHLQVTGFEVCVLEASDDIGGRLRTDQVDGLLLDRGFSLYNPSYAEGISLLDLSALDLRSLAPGVIAVRNGHQHKVFDPRRAPASVIDSALAPVGPLAAKLKFAIYASRLAIAASSDNEVDTSTASFLTRAFGQDLTDSLLRPFLSGVFLEDELATSKRVLDAFIKHFVQGTPGVPAQGMQEIARQVATQLTPGTVALNTRVTHVSAGMVSTTQGEIKARAIVLATDGHTSASLVSALPAVEFNSVTTWYHLADCPGGELTGGQSTLVIDSDSFSAGKRKTNSPLANTVVLTNAAPSYASNNRVLVSSSATGMHESATDEARVREHLAYLYGVDTAGWTPVATYAIKHALPKMLPPFTAEQDVRFADGLYLTGDSREVGSIQGTLHSARRAAVAVAKDLRG